MEQKILFPNSITIHPSSLEGGITIPPSKSQTLRAILFASLSSGKCCIRNYLPSPDTIAMIEACRSFGASITITPQELHIQGTSGRLQHLSKEIDAGNSGIILRFCSALGALSSAPVFITGDQSICTQRPMDSLIVGLEQLGVSVHSLEKPGYAPLRIQGPLQGGKARFSGEDSQPVSALLIAGSFSDQEIDLFIDNPGEKPWVSLTLNWLDRLQIRYTRDGFHHYHLFGKARYDGFDYTVPGDLSSAAFPIAAALITRSELTIHNIDLSENQGDKQVIFLFEKMGALFDVDPLARTLTVKSSGALRGIEADINDCIDGITILATVACYATGTTRLYNAAIARHKECNRIESIATELMKMGAKISPTHDGLLIEGRPLEGAHLHSYHDHRMALSLIVAAIGAKGSSTIKPVRCIEKTFPSFLSDLHTLGALALPNPENDFL